MDSIKRRVKQAFLPNRDEGQGTAQEASPGDYDTAGSVSRLFPGNNIYGLRELHTPKDATVDIVFLHGLNGRADKTFLHDSSGTYWPVDLLPNDIPDARIFTYGYDARVTAFFGPVGQNSLQDHASNLVNALATKRHANISTPAKIIFVVHSLGGLVVKSAIALSQASADEYLKNIEADTYGIMFLGTPHRGSDMAPFTKAIANIVKTAGKRTNTGILEVLQRNSQVLGLVEDNFSSWLRKAADRFHMTCFFEELELPLVGRVVERESATIAGWPKYSIRANHMDMVRFASSDHDGYQQISGELKRWVGQLNEKSRTLRAEYLNALYFQEWNARETRIDNVDQGGDWLLSHKEYLNWIESPSSDLLWIGGKPGSGKSTLVKHIAKKWGDEHNDPRESKLRNANHDRPTIVAAFYYSFRGGITETSHELMLRSIVFQIWSQDERLFPLLRCSPRRLKPNDQLRSNTRPSWGYDELKHILQRLHQIDFPIRILLLVDGMDESDSARRSDLLGFLEQLSLQTSDCVMKILIASRPETDISLRLHRSHHIILQQENMRDIRDVVLKWFNRLENHDMNYDNVDGLSSSKAGHHLSQFEEIKDYIVENSRGVFLWVTLVLRDLDRLIRKGAYTTASLKKRVQRLPRELGGPDGFYHAMVQYLIRQQEEDESLDEDDKEDERKRSRTLLTWTTFTKRPVQLSELEWALATPLQIDNTNLLGYDFEAHRPRDLERGLISYCGGLLEVRLGIVPNMVTFSMVQLIHQTTREFLLDRNRLAVPYDLDETEGDILISSTCSTTIRSIFRGTDLLMECDRDFSQIDLITASLERNKLLAYSLRFFMSHLQNISDGGTGIHGVFESFIEEISTKPTSYSALLLSGWIDRECRSQHVVNVNQEDVGRCLTTAMDNSIVNGRRDALWVLSHLCDSGNAHGGQYDNALQNAAHEGDNYSVRLLLHRGANVNARGGRYGTSLQAASHQGHEEIVRALLEHGADVRLAEGPDGRTALSMAVENGHEGVVKILQSHLQKL